MHRTGIVAAALAALIGISLLFSQRAPQVSKPKPDQAQRLAELRNVGKAFYENPTTQNEAASTFAEALKLNPTSTREQLNYALALLRANRMDEGVALLKKVQQQDPKLPHPYFNLGIFYKKDGQTEEAVKQFETLAKLDPKEAITRYNLGILYKQLGENDKAIASLQECVRLNPALQAPHFQLYNLYRVAGKRDEAAAELKAFQQLRAFTEERGDAVQKEDMDWSDYAEIYDPIEGALPATVPPTYESKGLDIRVDAPTGRSTLLQLRPDATGVLVWSRSGALALGEDLKPLPQPTEWKSPIEDAMAFDFNNDGLQDVLLITPTAAELWRNTGSGFEQATSLAAGSFRKALAVDFDHDYDLDVLLLGKESHLFRNEAEAGFNDRTELFPFVKGDALSGVVFKSVADTKGIDIVVSYADRDSVLYKDLLTATFEPRPFPLLPRGTREIAARDLDRNPELDLIFSSGTGVQGLWNKRGSFTAAPSVADEALGAAFFDFNKDGRLDRLQVRPDGSLTLDTNTKANGDHFVTVQLTGVKNLVSAPYAEVEVKAGALYRKQIYTGTPLTFALGPYTKVDTIRITWPNSLIQNEINVAADKAYNFKEAQRLSGSCPMIFSWNGQRFDFITDVLGVAPLGASSGDGEFFPTDSNEYIQIPGKQLQARNGRYDIRITEELGEVSYLDQLELLAVDHPADTEVFSNERWKSPPYPEFRLYGIKQRLYPKRARDHRGNDQLASILNRDQRYADSFRRTMANTAEWHHLELDFGDVARNGKAVLVLNGWVDWADGSTFINRAQGRKEPITPPSLQMKDAGGNWVTVLPDLGMPSGKTKTFAVDLSGLWPSQHRAVRIVTNMCVFWDEVFLGEDPSQPTIRIQKVPLAKASMQFHGFSKSIIHPERRKPEHFEYTPTTFTSLWNPTPGMYTRYGPIESLVHDIDDRLAIMGSGDEVHLSYDASKLTGLPQGWTRDFQLRVEGWAKDSDANTAFGQQVGPLPFHAMKQYPYAKGERYPDRDDLKGWQREYNTRPALKLLRPLR